jgi:heat shock protein HslJ
MKKYIQFLMVTVFVITSSCSSSKPATGSAPDKAIADIYWRLTELNGKPIVAGPDKKEVYIRLKKEGNLLQGFAGCNGFGGQYNIEDGGKISFTNIMGTMMACDRTKDENKLYEALRECDNYIHLGKKLILNKGKKAPLARFEADYAK